MKKITIALSVLLICAGVTSCGEKSETAEDGPSTKIKVQPTSVTSNETGCEGGDDEDPEPMIYGTVQDTTDNDPIVGACVALMSGTEVIAQTGTDESGHYYFNTASNGQYAIRFIAEGYVVKFGQASIVNQTPYEVNVKLRPQ